MDSSAAYSLLEKHKKEILETVVKIQLMEQDETGGRRIRKEGKLNQPKISSKDRMFLERLLFTLK